MNKEFVNLEDDIHGRKVAEDIGNGYGAVIVAENTILCEKSINKLRNLNIDIVRVYEDIDLKPKEVVESEPEKEALKVEEKETPKEIPTVIGNEIPKPAVKVDTKKEIVKTYDEGTKNSKACLLKYKMEKV